MKPKSTFLIVSLLVLFLIILPVSRGRGESPGFVIIGADASAYLTMSGSSQLNNLVGQVPARFVVQTADQMRYIPVVKYPSALQPLLDTIGTRFIFQMADSNRFIPVSYPRDLIGDTIPPNAGQVSVSSSGNDRVTLTWTSNEYATSEIRFGLSSNSYGKTALDNLFRIQHQMTISGLIQGTKYYYRILSTDRSGNSGQTSESTFSPANIQYIYLPLTVKQ